MVIARVGGLAVGGLLVVTAGGIAVTSDRDPGVQVVSAADPVPTAKRSESASDRAVTEPVRVEQRGPVPRSAPAVDTPPVADVEPATERVEPVDSGGDAADVAATESADATAVAIAAPASPVNVATDCVIGVGPGETLAQVAARFDDPIVAPETLIAENGLRSGVVVPGGFIDVCVDNGRNDVTGAAHGERNAAAVELGGRLAIMAQQRKLNELFAGYGIEELLVDGDSGTVTRQRLCAARVALGLPVHRRDMEPGSEEEQVLMAAAALRIPATSATKSSRWILIDRTCQVMFVGSGADRLEFVFPASTGQAGFATRTQDRTPAFRYNPASWNGGWHNSTTYPVAADNPLNGNMYRPLYFDRGQAIHGATNVPRSPASKGCVRLRVANQDTLIGWLGLAGRNRPTNDRGRINVTVNVQGSYWGS